MHVAIRVINDAYGCVGGVVVWVRVSVLVGYWRGAGALQTTTGDLHNLTTSK